MSLFLLAALSIARADVLVPEPAEWEPELARRVAEAAGDPYAEQYLAFTFVVISDGQEKVRRSHRWCPQAGRVQVRTDDTTTTVSAVDGSALDAATGEQAAAEAWGAFINDGYWLLAASKVLDPGVKRSTDGNRLSLSFDGVGLTPGDRYTLTVQEQTGLVTRWDFVLESGREGHFSWEDYQQHGGLMLSTRRVSDQGSFEIRFEGIQVGASCPL